jgi:hypothetical protein
MPLHVARLRDSDLAAEEDPEACWYAVLLWSAAWHQLPAGSLPNNDTVLMRLCGLGRDQRTWKRHRAGAMRGWEICTDGRFYHRVVAEQVNESWRKKIEQRWRTECARIRKANQRNHTDLPQPAFADYVASDWPLSVTFLSQGHAPPVPSDSGGLSHGTDDEVPGDIASKRQRQRDSNSVADATGGAPPIDPAKLVFDSGIAILGSVGITEKRARPILGRWRQQHGDPAVIDALGKASRESPSDPTAFIEACLQGTSNGNGPRHGGANGAVRHRPDPALALLHAATEEEESAAGGGSGGWRAGASLPGIAPH